MPGISINGIACEYISAMDRGLHYGDGVFETIACVDGKLQFWEQHMRRMAAGASSIDLEFPGDAKLLQDISELCKNTLTGSFVIKILLTRGQGERGYRVPRNLKSTRIVICSNWPDHQQDLVESGIKLHLCKHPVSINTALAGIKHLNRLDSVLARNEWQDDYHEGLMQDNNGNIIEGTMSNVFGFRQGVLYTPDLAHCGIDGIIRNQVLEIAHEENIETNVCAITVDDLYSMNEVFVTNSLIGIWPVSLIGENNFRVGSITHKLVGKLRRRMLEDVTALA